MSDPEAFYCRLCAKLKSKSDLVFIKNDGGINRKIYEIVLESFHLDNSFPSFVCPDCWVQASSVYDLHEKVLHAQDILRHINQTNIQISPMNVENASIRVETEEATNDSVYDLNNIDGKFQTLLDRIVLTRLRFSNSSAKFNLYFWASASSYIRSDVKQKIKHKIFSALFHV